jgi:nitrogen-specific signal transduction histidine kinase
MKGLAEGRRTEGTDETTLHLRRLAHDLSNSLETIVQAAYLLEQATLDEKVRKWSKLIDTAAKDAVRLNRQIREILKSHA